MVKYAENDIENFQLDSGEYHVVIMNELVS